MREIVSVGGTHADERNRYHSTLDCSLLPWINRKVFDLTFACLVYTRNVLRTPTKKE